MRSGSPGDTLLELADRRVNSQRAGSMPPSLALDGYRGDGGSNRLPRAAEVAGRGLRGPRARFRSPAARALSFSVLHEVEERTPHRWDCSVWAFRVTCSALSRC